MHRNVTEKNVRHRALKDCKKAGVGPLAAMYVRSGFFIPRASCKPSRERMCLGALSGGLAALDGNKSVPSREPMCSAGP